MISTKLRQFKDEFFTAIRAENRGRLYAMRLLCSWLAACLVHYAVPAQRVFSKEYSGAVSIPLFCLTVVACWVLLSAVKLIPKIGKMKTDSLCLLLTSAIFAAVLSAIEYFSGSKTEVFYAAAPLVALCIWYTLGKDDLHAAKMIKKCSPALIAAAVGVMALFTVFAMAARYYALYTPCFDFGIFAQMFENMKDSFEAVTTVERNYLLSHMAVHFSPAYYLMLPFYLIYPHPVTLQVLQGLAVVSGVIPVLLITKKYGFSKMKCAIICAVYALYPAFIGGCSYDIHENCMLLPFLMWLFWAIEREKLPFIGLFTLLVLSVKEDAAVYTAVIGLYIMLSDRSKKVRIAGVFVSLGSVVYFLLVCAFLNSSGLGIMSWRYNIYLPGADAGLAAVIITVLTNPGYVIANLLTDKKAEFAIQMTASLGFIPLITKKFHRYILLIPFILVNLMPDYQYQHSIFFQYIFGTGALLFWLFIMNLSELKHRTQKCVCTFSFIACIMIVCSAMPGMLSNFERATQEKAEIIAYLEQLPVTDESITADTFFIAPLFRQKELYAISTSEKPSEKTAPPADIVLLDKQRPHYETTLDYYLSCGMTEVPIDNEYAAERICRLEK